MPRTARVCTVSTLTGIVATGLLALAAGPALAADELITNGGFESPQVSDAPGYQVYPAGSRGITGWTVVSGSVDLVRTSFYQAAEGTQSLDLDGDSAGAIRQDVAVEAGKTYTVGFRLAGNPGGNLPPIKRVSVSFAGQDRTFTVDTSQQPSRQDLAYRAITFTAAVPAGSAITTPLTFSSGDDASSNGGVAVDAVSVTAADAPTPVVPEVPAAALLAVVGLGVVGASVAVVRRRSA